MERKYYLRGLGLGIAVTAVIMGIALSGNRSMTNEEIIARAKELGLVENTVLADTGSEDSGQENVVDDVGQDIANLPQNDVENMQNDLAAAGTETDADDVTDDDTYADDPEVADVDGAHQDTEADNDDKPDNDEENPASEDNDVGSEEQNNVTDLTADDNEVGDDAESAVPVTIKVITINSGDGSYTVAKKLENVGVVSSASTFDAFLCQNGYDKRLRTGNFSIPTDASDEQIARIITGLE